MPDLEHKSSAAITQGCAGPIGKGCMVCNYHSCLSVILQSFKSNQGMNKPIYGFVQIGNHVARHHLFFPLAFVIGDGLSGDQLCRRYKNTLHVLPDYLAHVMYPLVTLMIPSRDVII